ncbi:MAG: tetratricopeptide repeat protein [Thermoleophilia bacterium]|nr:tetratricopeptide repeat protein [Thermoleophilia bacterium]
MNELARQRFDEACDHDRAGREEEAIPCYVEALELGLGDPWRSQALLGLGSSYRNVLRHADAISVLSKATAEYPDDDALRVFLALALWSGGREREAFELLGKVVVDTVDLHGYRRAASTYFDHIE